MPRRQTAANALRYSRLAVRFTDFPTPAIPKDYDEAIASYVGRVTSRAKAIYQVGTVHAPGLSDIDLIVVPGPPRLDDDFFYSARTRLPRAQARFYEGDPRLVPVSLGPVLRYTSHGNRRLLWGEDVFASIEQDESREQRWSILLEGFVKYEAWLAKVRRRQRASVHKIIAKAYSLHYAFADLDHVAGLQLCAPFHARVDALRAGYFAAGEPPEQKAAVGLELLESGLALLESHLKEILPLGRGESVSEFAFDFLNSGREIPGLDGKRLSERRRAIRDYQLTIWRLGYFRGEIFGGAAYSERRRRYRRRSPAALALWPLLGLGYRIRGASERLGKSPHKAARAG